MCWRRRRRQLGTAHLDLLDLELEVVDGGLVALALAQQLRLALRQCGAHGAQLADLVVLVLQELELLVECCFGLFEFLSGARELGALEVALFEQLSHVRLLLLERLLLRVRVFIPLIKIKSIFF